MKRQKALSVALIVLGLSLAAVYVRAEDGWGFVCYQYGQVGQEYTIGGTTTCYNTITAAPMEDSYVDYPCDWESDDSSKVEGCDY